MLTVTETSVANASYKLGVAAEVLRTGSHSASEHLAGCAGNLEIINEHSVSVANILESLVTVAESLNDALRTFLGVYVEAEGNLSSAAGVKR